jgi:hypothetical protein
MSKKERKNCNILSKKRKKNCNILKKYPMDFFSTIAMKDPTLHFFFFFFFICLHIREGKRTIQTSDIRFMRRDTQPIELPLETIIHLVK